MISLQAPAFFFAVGQGYRNFTQTSDDEVVALLSCTKVPIHWRVLYAVAIYTGARAGELAALSAPDADLPALTCLPVVRVGTRGGPGAATANTPAQAAWLAGRMLGLKYPDVQARLQMAQLEVTEIPGESRVSPTSSRTPPTR